MKKFPRLYSLSTLGIRQHQEFDYLLHGFRTDFVGDSGCGKSMIADLIQLVFVGSEMFASGTDSMDKREVDGMVLRSHGTRGTDMGYVLLNIEIDPNQYVAIGAYLESTTRQSRSFIIQSHYDENELQPLSRSLGVSDILCGDQIPTMEMLKEALEIKGFILHDYPKRKKFHAYISKHKLLSIDLSQSSQVLKDYATIIQSFSRGKTLDISDSASLKRFLFGNEKAKEITQKYKKAVEELQVVLKEHAQNRDEIRIATQKHGALKALRTLKDRLDKDEEDFYIKQYAFANQEVGESQDILKKSLLDFNSAKNVLETLRQIIENELESSEDNFNKLSLHVEDAKNNYNKSLIQYQQLLPYLKLVEHYTCSDTELINIYSEYQKNKQYYQIISEVNMALKKDNLVELLNNYIHYNQVSDILDAISEDQHNKKLQQLEKEKLLDFADLNNEGALGYWAIQNYQSHSLEVESLLMRFKDLPVLAPAEGHNKYVPNPELLIREIGILEKVKDGFWISLGNIKQYIPYVKKRLFSATNTDELKTSLISLSKNLKTEVTQLTQDILRLKLLKDCITSIGAFSTYLDISNRDSVFVNFELEPDLDIPRHEFEGGLALLKESVEIELAYKQTEKIWSSSTLSLKDYETSILSLKNSNIRIQGLLESNVSIFGEGLEVAFADLGLKEINQNEDLKDLKFTFETTEFKEKWAEMMINSNAPQLNVQGINQIYQNYEKNKEFSRLAFVEARLVLEREPDISIYCNQNIEKPIEEENRYKLSKSLYKERFIDVVGQYAEGESYRFESTQNYLELCTTILPDAFLEERIDEETSIEVIWDYLSKINDKNKNLNNRKLVKIRDILDEVGDEVSKREDTVRQIHNFLDNGDREITGGHRASLRTNHQHCYPKGWIDTYIDKLKSENTLFSTGETLNEILNDSVSLEEKMVNAFYAFGGHRGAKPKVEDLLNPNSYFNLSFQMESHASGKKNIGSTGQVYAAIALLCIARLSLVNKSSINKTPPRGIRFMPIDEAEGLGSNFDLLYDIAREFDYQILTMGIKPLGRFREGEQYIYMLSNNKEVTEDVNYQPFAVFCEADQKF
jgi:hypothetical protein